MAGKKAVIGNATTVRDLSVPSEPADAKVAELTDWRSNALARIRHLIFEADPDVIEEVKWRKPTNPAGVSVWSHAEISAQERLTKTR